MLLGIDETRAGIQWGVIIIASLVAAVFDIRQRRIPNFITIALLITGMVKSLWYAGPWGLAESAGTCIILALPFVLLFLFANGGAGDAKLMGAIGTWVGFDEGIRILICVVLAGIIMALLSALIKGRLKIVLVNIYASVYTFVCFVLSHETKQYLAHQNAAACPKDLTIPYGVAIFAGVIAALGLILLM